jgi:predicted DsbA family dithiol-disulfide isomerase
VPVHIDVWSDFVCPFCFLVISTLEKLREDYDVGIRWRSFLLRPPGRPPLSTEGRGMIEAEYRHVQQLARTQYGIELRPGPIGIHTLTAHIAVKYAESHTKGDLFHSAVMNAYWQEARPIDDKEVLKSIATQVGLNGEGLATAWKDSTFAAAVKADIHLAAAYRIHSVPTLIFNEKYPVIGAQPYQVLKRVMDNIQKEGSSNNTKDPGGKSK